MTRAILVPLIQVIEMDPHLRALLDKEQIREQLYKYCRAVDRNDRKLMAEVYHADAIDCHGVFEGPAAEFIRLDIESVLPGLKTTMHLIGNILIDLDGDVARVESYVAAYHRIDKPDGAHDLQVWGRYLDRFERRDQIWRIAHRRCVFDAIRNDPASADWQMSWCQGFRPLGRRDGDDPVFALLK